MDSGRSCGGVHVVAGVGGKRQFGIGASDVAAVFRQRSVSVAAVVTGDAKAAARGPE